MASNVPRHRIFISYYDEDRKYKDRFVRTMGDKIIDRSVQVGNIVDDNLLVETIRQTIRDEYIADATVTVVLIGPCTWQRKHVDWEIGSSLRDTNNNSRCGLVGILLPHHPDYDKDTFNPNLIPPRLADNCNGDDSFASIYDYPKRQVSATIKRWIHEAFVRRRGTPPDNSRIQYGRNRSGPCARGWTD